MTDSARPPRQTDDPLRVYRTKRNFAVTSEPREGGTPSSGGLTFVVQKHWASSLHYDFRLELDGTMKSWAVPKGPSFDPRVKRMAVEVEDHPISYASFEGTIPSGEYGAGRVIVWDNGGWTPLVDPQQGLRDGNLKFELHGHKLHGRWVLVRMKGKDGRQKPWLLIKEKDAFARAAEAFSVVDEMPDSVAGKPHPGGADRAGPIKSVAKVSARRRASAATAGAAGKLEGAIAAALPAQLAPQLATLARSAPSSPAEWIFEIKFDGYRMLVRVDGKGVRLFTRNGNDWTAKLGSLEQALAGLKLPAGWYDGEIVVQDANGIPGFGELQDAFAREDTHGVVLYLFDLPYCDGHDLRAVPLDARRALLGALLAKTASEQVRFSEVFDAPPEHIVESACRLGLEGIIAKRRSSGYRSARSADWLKLKCGLRQEFVVVGYTDPQGARTGLGALLLGVHDASGVLQYAGNVGTGFSERTLVDLRRRLDAVRRTTRPFDAAVKVPGRPHWTDPVLVAEVSFGEWTRAGHIRHAVFRGLRTDKEASMIVREKPVPSTGRATPPSRRASAEEVPRAAAGGAMTVKAGRALGVTHPERVIDAATGTTKIELVRYYGLIGALMMKHLKGRPVSLVRAPAGVDGQLFFQKHVDSEKLPGIGALDQALDPGHPAMIEITEARGLLSAAQWNVIEVHTMNTGRDWFEHPDRMVFDLDPGQGVPWAQVQDAAQLMNAFLARLGLQSFLKTSGGKGLHVVVPLRRIHDWDTVKGFSQAIVQHMARTIPKRFVDKSGPKNRVGRIFIDYLRNGAGATTVCAWSARARPGLGISVPVAWSELPSLRGGDHWTVKTVHTRLDAGNDPWTSYARAARGLKPAMAELGWSPPQK